MVWCLVLFLSIYKVSAEELPVETFPTTSNCSEQKVGSSEENYAQIPVTFPTTSFTCWGRFDGYYADVEVDCTIFHYCQTWNFPSGRNETVKWDFVCPQNTIFNQKLLSCVPPNISFECQDSPSYYWVNKNLHGASSGIEMNATPNSNYYNSQQLVDCPCENTELKPNQNSQSSSPNNYGNYAHHVPLYPTYPEFHGLSQNPSDAEYSQFNPTESTHMEYHDSHRFNPGYEVDLNDPANAGKFDPETPQTFNANNIPIQQNFPQNEIPVNYIEFSAAPMVSTAPVEAHDQVTLNSKSFNGSTKAFGIYPPLNVTTHKNHGDHIYGFESASFKQEPSISEFGHSRSDFPNLKNIIETEVSNAYRNHFSDNSLSQNLPDSGQNVLSQTFSPSANVDRFTFEPDKQNSTGNFGAKQYAHAIFSSPDEPREIQISLDSTEPSVVESAKAGESSQQHTFKLNTSTDNERDHHFSTVDSNATFEFSEPSSAPSEDLRIFFEDQAPDSNRSFLPLQQDSQPTVSPDLNEPFVTFPLVVPTFPDEAKKVSDETTQYFHEGNGTLTDKNASRSSTDDSPVVSSVEKLKTGSFHSQTNFTDLGENIYLGSGEPPEANAKDDDIEELVKQNNPQSRARYFLIN